MLFVMVGQRARERAEKSAPMGALLFLLTRPFIIPCFQRPRACLCGYLVFARGKHGNQIVTPSTSTSTLTPLLSALPLSTRHDGGEGSGAELLASLNRASFTERL